MVLNMADMEEALNHVLPHRRERQVRTYILLRRQNQRLRTTDRQIPPAHLHRQELRPARQ